MVSPPSNSGVPDREARSKYLGGPPGRWAGCAGGPFNELSNRGADMPTIVAPGSLIGTRCGSGIPYSSSGMLDGSTACCPLDPLPEGCAACAGSSSADLPGRTAGVQSLPLYLYQRSLSSPIIHQ